MLPIEATALSPVLPQVEVPTTFKLGRRRIPFGEVSRRVEGSLWGEILSHNTRFDGYKPEGTSNERWVQLLGSDVHNRDHQRHQYGLTRQGIKYHLAHEHAGNILHPDARLSVSEQQTALLLASLHDIAESIHGDKPAPLKTAQDDDEELATLSWMIPQMLDGYNRRRVDTITPRLINILRHPQKDKIGRLFKTWERVGYLRTGLTAWHRAHPDLTPDRKSKQDIQLTNGEKRNLTWLGHDMVQFYVPGFIKQADIYPSVDAFLVGGRHHISHVYSNAEQVWDKNSMTDDQADKFMSTRDIWHDFLHRRGISA